MSIKEILKSYSAYIVPFLTAFITWKAAHLPDSDMRTYFLYGYPIFVFILTASLTHIMDAITNIAVKKYEEVEQEATKLSNNIELLRKEVVLSDKEYVFMERQRQQLMDENILLKKAIRKIEYEYKIKI